MSVRSYLTRLIFCLVYYQRDLTCSILLFETGINKQRRKSRRGLSELLSSSGFIVIIPFQQQEIIASRIPDTGKWRTFHREKCLSRVNMNASF